MSLAINCKEVTKVLLPDGWHQCVPKSFLLDAYEYTGIEDDDHYMTATPFGTGYTFTEIGGGSHGDQLYGPVESVLAVRTSRPPAYA